MTMRPGAAFGSASSYWNRALSRRRLIRGAAIAGLGGLSAGLLAACGGSASSPAKSSASTASSSGSGSGSGTATSSQASGSPASGASTGSGAGAPKKGGSWSLALLADGVAYPITLPNALPSLLVCKTMFNDLTKFELQGNTIVTAPDLADSWQANPDLTEYTFKLHPGVKWHDGKPLTADDVKFTIDAMLNPKVNGAEAGNISSIKETQVVDPLTVKFILKYPYSDLPTMLGYLQFVCPKHLLEGQDLNNPTEFLKHPVGTGPFMFKSMQTGSFLETVANPNYFKGAPYLNSVIDKVIPNPETQVSNLRAGELDFCVLGPQDVASLKSASNVMVRAVPQIRYEYVGFNHKSPLFQDVRVRQALDYAIDKEAIIKNVLLGYATVATGPINPALGKYYNPNVQTYSYSMDKATSLLKEAGWTKGSDGILTNSSGKKFHVRLISPNNVPAYKQIVVYLQQQYQKLGLSVDVQVDEWTVNATKTKNFQYELMMYYWQDPPSPDMYDHYYSTSTSNSWAYSNKQVDDLIIKARSEPDTQKRVQDYHQLQEIVAKDLPVIYLYNLKELQGINARTQGFPKMGYRNSLLYMNKVWLG